MFFGFARYHLRHGVPWSHPTGPYRRVTVTLRSVPLPTAKRGARRAAEAATHEPDAAKRKQRKLMDVLLGGLPECCCLKGVEEGELFLYEIR